MQVAVLTGIKEMEIREAPAPVVEKPDDVLLKVERVGVCGSDVHYYETGRIGSQVCSYPYRVGHECSGTAAAVGRGVTRVQVGDPVAVDPAIVCHECDQCRAGRENTCRKLSFLGCPDQSPGCLAEYIVMPEDSLYPVNGRVGLDRACLSEPFTIGVYAVRQAKLGAESRIAILGAGPIGLSCLTAARAAGVEKCYITDKLDYRVGVGWKAGATYAANPDTSDVVGEIFEQTAGGVDVVFECCGDQAAADQAIEMLNPGGTLAYVGIPREDRISFLIDQCRRKEITIVNVRRQNKCVQAALDLIEQGSVDIDYMITHRFSFGQVKEAFDLVAGYRDGVIKAVVEI